MPAVTNVLDEFFERLRQKVNLSKSKVHSPNIDREKRESLCNNLGFSSTSNLGKYLGFPIKHPRNSNLDLNCILDRVKQRLSGCKANLLSLAGQATLVQSITSAMPAYVMQCVSLLANILSNLD